MRSAACFVALVLLAACNEPGATRRLHGPLELVLLHTADTHSMLFPYAVVLGTADERRGFGRAGELAFVGGFARLATLLRAERAAAKRVLHVDSGDLFQGSLEFETFGGEPELRAFDALGVDAQALGNHELDRGVELVAERYEELARFPLLAANYAVDGPGGLGGVVSPFTVLDAHGLRVGVIGVGNVSSVALLRERPNELAVLARDAAGSVQGALDTLRPLVDVVVVASHLGLDADRELVRRTSGIDLVLGGHQHLTLDEPVWELDCGGGAEPRVVDAWGSERTCAARRVPIVHSGAYGKTFARLTLSLDDDPSRLGATDDPLDAHEVVRLEHELVPVSPATADDSALAALLEPYRRREPSAFGAESVLAYAPHPLERTGATGGDSPLGNFAAEAARAAAQSDLVVLGASSLRADLPPGLVDLAGLVRVLPFEDPVVSFELEGARLLAAIEHAARSASARDCRTQIQVAGMLVRFRCPCEGTSCARGFAPVTDVACDDDSDCASMAGACGEAYGGSRRCFAKVMPNATFRIATTAYLAGGGSGLFDAVPEPIRTTVADALSAVVADALRGGERCPQAPTSNTDKCASGCGAALLRAARDACEALGLGEACPARAVDCDAALAACRALPCFESGRDGRIRFEAP